MKQGLFVLFVVLQLMPFHRAVAGEKDFTAWWKSDNGQEAASSVFRKKAELSFNGLKEEKKRRVIQPISVQKEVESLFQLSNQKNLTLLLATPRNTMKNRTTIDNTYYEEMQKCAGDHSWIVAEPEHSWSEIDLNPYCDESYGEDEISFVLYWVGGSIRPYLEVIMNAPSCINHRLYQWDKKFRKYTLAAEKCSGT